MQLISVAPVIVISGKLSPKTEISLVKFFSRFD